MLGKKNDASRWLVDIYACECIAKCLQEIIKFVTFRLLTNLANAALDADCTSIGPRAIQINRIGRRPGDPNTT